MSLRYVYLCIASEANFLQKYFSNSYCDFGAWSCSSRFI